MAAKALVETVIDKRVSRKLRDKHFQIINVTVKSAPIWQWQDFGKEDKKKSNKVDQLMRVQWIRVWHKSMLRHGRRLRVRLEQRVARKSLNPGEPSPITIMRTNGHIQKYYSFLMRGARMIFIPTQGLTQLQLNALPRPESLLYPKNLDPQHIHKLFAVMCDPIFRILC